MEAVEHRFRAMASEVQVIVVDGAAELGELARRRLEQLERRWSRFLPDSALSRVNLQAGEPVLVDADTLTLFSVLVQARELTAGWFDPSVLPALLDAGYHASIEDPSRVTVLPDGFDHRRLIGDTRAVIVDHDAGTVTVPHGTAVDPGGLGKGLAADLVAGEMLAGGAAGALVSIGGDLAIAGEATTVDGWQVVIEHPDRAGQALCTVAIECDVFSRAGVATSSTRSRTWRHSGRSYHHLIDPSTGQPSSSDLAAVTVVAPNGWQAEAHATAALLQGSEHVHAYLEMHGLSGLAITVDGTVLRTPDLVEAAVVR